MKPLTEVSNDQSSGAKYPRRLSGRCGQDHLAFQLHRLLETGVAVAVAVAVFDRAWISDRLVQMITVAVGYRTLIDLVVSVALFRAGMGLVGKQAGCLIVMSGAAGLPREKTDQGPRCLT